MIFLYSCSYFLSLFSFTFENMQIFLFCVFKTTNRSSSFSSCIVHYFYMLRYRNRDTFSYTNHANLFRKNKNYFFRNEKEEDCLIKSES